MLNEFAIIEEKGICDETLADAIKHSIESCKSALKKVLLVVPDYTRFHSNAGRISEMYYNLLKDTCRVDILVALGTHVPMTEAECADMYGDIPYERFIMHNWRSDIIKIGTVPGEFVSSVSESIVNSDIEVEVNKKLFDGYDLILSIGQVVPHEVVGMANHSKNILVGCGGSAIINASHMLGASYGMERIMGKDFSPVRKVFDYAMQHFLSELPISYVLTVTTAPKGNILTHGLYFGKDRKWFEEAVALAQKTNLTLIDSPFKKVVVYLDEHEFKTTWLGNKSIYRTRMAIADGGELIVLAPGVVGFGEDEIIDRLIRKYGYTGRVNISELYLQNEELRNNASAAAHLIHGSSDGRFSVVYCTRHLTKKEVESVNFEYMPYDDAASKYDHTKLKDGFNTLEDGEEIYYISNPALGLWADKDKFQLV